MIVIACGAALLIAAAVAVVVASRNRQQPAPPPDVPVAASPAEVRVKAVERKPEPTDHEVVEAATAVAIVCGADPATADRYEARNDALRLIACRRGFRMWQGRLGLAARSGAPLSHQAESSRGRVTVNVVPLPRVESTLILPL